MVADIKPMKDDSLDEVARLMNDVQRRLDLGRAGTRVREEEQEIVDKLEKMIEQIETADQTTAATATTTAIWPATTTAAEQGQPERSKHAWRRATGGG